MLNRDEWAKIARQLDWEFSYVDERDLFPEDLAGKPHLRSDEWRKWDEPFKTTMSDYFREQTKKEDAVSAVHEAISASNAFSQLSRDWVNSLKLHAATLPLAEFAAVVGNLRAARFGRTTPWRLASLLGAMDELRHTQIPLKIMHDLVKWDRQFDWTHKFYHSDNWVAIAGRHLVDEMLILSDPIEFAIATNFVFETGFTNLQFIGLSELAKHSGDVLFDAMIKSIQSDEARHAQIGPAVLEILVKHDPEYAQRLVDKWFWRSWLMFSIVTGFSMDYLTPLSARKQSFKEFVHEWVIEQYLNSLGRYGLQKPWYWDTFLESLDSYHHMVYASAYTYRSTVWFNFAMPGPDERRWLEEKYPSSWKNFEPIWANIERRWSTTDPGLDLAVHGTAIVTFCSLCQLVLCNGNPKNNTAISETHDGEKYIFCSEPCRWIFNNERERYSGHKDIVKRVLAGELPGNVIDLIHNHFGLRFEDWGKDAFEGKYQWLTREPPPRSAEGELP